MIIVINLNKKEKDEKLDNKNDGVSAMGWVKAIPSPIKLNF